MIQLNRDVIAVLGKTGYGKSVWSRKYLTPRRRIFVFDIMRNFPCEYIDSERLIEKYDNSEFDLDKEFIVGSANLADLELMGALSMLAGNCILFVEECAISFDKYGRIPEWLRDIVFLGRHRGVSILVTAQRAASVPIDLRSQVSRLVTFQQSEGDDLSWLKPYLGKEDLAELPYLEKLECIDCDNGNKTRYSITY